MEAGCPQEAILSPLLFNIMLSDLPLDDVVQVLSNADDITLVLTGKDNMALQTLMPSYLSKVVGGWGLTVNPSKSSMQWFSKTRIVDISIKIETLLFLV